MNLIYLEFHSCDYIGNNKYFYVLNRPQSKYSYYKQFDFDITAQPCHSSPSFVKEKKRADSRLNTEMSSKKATQEKWTAKGMSQEDLMKSDQVSKLTGLFRISIE